MASWFRTPLAGTALAFAGLALLALPLRQLTGRGGPPGPAVDPMTRVAGVESALTPAVIRLKLIHPLASLALRDRDGAPLLELDSPPAGESEHDIPLALDDRTLELSFGATAGDEETAVFLTVMPDHLPDQTRYVTGSGALVETLRYDWRDESDRP